MKKTTWWAALSCTLLLAVALGLVPAVAYAAGEETVEAAAPEPVMVTDGGPALDSDELLAGYLEQRLSEALPVGEGEQLTTQSVAEGLTGNTAVAYQLIKAEVEKIAAGERSSTVIEIEIEDLNDKVGLRWSPADLGVETFASNGYWTDEGLKAIQEKILDLDFTALADALMSDNPYEMYWFDKTTGYKMIFSAGTYSNGDCTLQSATVGMRFSVSQEYSASGAKGTYETNLPDVTTAVTNAKAIVSRTAGSSTYERMAAYKEAICDLVSYNYDAASDDDTPYGNPWQLIYVFDGDTSTNVVCEGYSKAFKYLCDLSGFRNVECLLVAGTLGGGTGSGGHMWNVVKMYDGKSYLVDVTNCDDDSIGAPDKLFFKAPTSGSVTGAYTYQFDSLNRVTFSYDADMFDLFTQAELTLAAADFDPSAVAEPAVVDLSAATVTAAAQTYTGAALEPAVTVTLDGMTLTEGTDYTVTYLDNTNAGEATILVEGSGDYTGTAEGSFTINPKAVTPQVTLSSKTPFTYTGKVQKPSVSMVTADGETLDSRLYSTSIPNAVDAGRYTVTVTLLGNYTGSGTATFDIERAAQTITVSETAPSVAVGQTLALGVTAEGALSYGSSDKDVATVSTTGVVTGVSAGEATITITAGATTNYKAATTSVTVTVEPAELADDDVSAPADQTYTGGQLKPAITVSRGSITLVAGTDYTLAYGANTNAGTGTVTVTGAGNYQGSVTKYFDIATASISGATVSAAEQTYTGSALTPEPTVIWNGRELTKDSDYTVSYTDNTKVGTATITVTGRGNFTGAATANFTILEAPVQKTDLSSATVEGLEATYYFWGDPVEPQVTVVLDGQTLTQGSDYTASYTNSSSYGQATLTLKGIGNYTGSIVCYYNIMPYDDTVFYGLRDATVTFPDMPSDGLYVYSGTPLTPAPQVVVNGVTLQEGVHYTLSYENNTGVGTATVHICGIDDHNCSGQQDVSFLIAKKSGGIHISNAKIVCSIPDQAYTGYEVRIAEKDKPVVTYGSKTLVEGSDYVLMYQNAVEKGTGKLVIAGTGSYYGICTLSFRIGDLISDGSKILLSYGYPYYTGEPRYSYPNLQKNATGTPSLKQGIDYDVTIEPATDAGADVGKVTVTGKGAYIGSFSYTYPVLPAAISAATVEAIEPQAYTGSTIEPRPQVTWGGMTLEEGRDYTLSYGNNTGVGTATVTISGTNDGNLTGTGNFQGTKTVTFEIVPAAAEKATPSFTGAEPVTLAYGKTLALDVATTGDGALSYASTDESVATVSGEGVVTPTGVGAVDVVVSAAETESFAAASTTVAVTVVKGTVTITVPKATVEVVAGKSATIGAKVSAHEGAITYAIANKKLATVSQAGKVATKKGAGGSTTVTVRVAESDNYKAASKTVTVRVGKANTLAAKAKSKTVTAKYSTLKKKAVTLASNAKVSKAKGKVSYANASTNATAKKFKVNAKNGKLTVPKGTKKGTYTVKVRVTAAGVTSKTASKNYVSGTKTITYKVKVK